MFASIKKHRQFDLQKRLGAHSNVKVDDDKRIKFARLPKKKVKPIWWSVVAFAAVLYFFIYLINY